MRICNTALCIRNRVLGICKQALCTPGKRGQCVMKEPITYHIMSFMVVLSITW